MKAKIHYYDIGDYLSREEKLKTIERFGSIENIPWTIIDPNEHGDWLNKRSELFKLYTPLEPVKKFDQKSKSVFAMYAIGLASNRDSWVYSFSCNKIFQNMKKMIEFYNSQQKAYHEALAINKELKVEDFISTDSKNISWTRALRRDVANGEKYEFSSSHVRIGYYRPYCKNNLYYDHAFIESPGLSKKLYPTPQHQNLIICVSGIGASKDFSVLITNSIPNLDTLEKSQCFPLYWYEDMSPNIYKDSTQLDFFLDPEHSYTRHDGMTDWILTTAHKQYGNKVTKEDIFYYVYGILHSPDYRAAFSADLKKSLPRLPLVDSADDFWAFSHAGRKLAELHLNYETIEPYRGCMPLFNASTLKGESVNYRVEKMRFGKIDSKTANKTIIHYNNAITIEKIPLEAYEYVVNGKSAIEWIMDRYQIKTDPASGITNDPNDWAKEHNDEKYIYNLLLRIINVSIKTMKIVKTLPKLEFRD